MFVCMYVLSAKFRQFQKEIYRSHSIETEVTKIVTFSQISVLMFCKYFRVFYKCIYYKVRSM